MAHQQRVNGTSPLHLCSLTQECITDLSNVHTLTRSHAHTLTHTHTFTHAKNKWTLTHAYECA